MNYSISTDKSKLDISLIHDYLCNQSYWAQGRSLEKVKKSIEHAICFGMYDIRDQMLGFARVVTDHVAFAFLMDVFVLKEHQGQGLGKGLVKHIVGQPDLQVKLWMLGTVDAHGLYKQFGFSELANPSRFLAIKDECFC